MRPLDLFLDWYLELANTDPAGKCSDELFDSAVREALGSSRFKVQENLILGQYDATLDRKVRVLELIDEFANLVHPRCAMLTLGKSLPAWLCWAEDRRLQNGCFAEKNGKRLILRGPLGREACEPDLAYTEKLVDRFRCLRVVSSSYCDQNSRILEVQILPQTMHALFSARTRNERDRTRIAFAPVAMGNSDWSFEVELAVPHEKIRIAPASSICAKERMMDAIVKASGVDILIAPEFTVPVEKSIEISTAMSELEEECPSLVIAGSGVTSEENQGLPWNETRVLNAYGRALFSQRKLFPSQIHARRLRELGVEISGERGVESTGRGNCIQFGEAPGLGRLLVLICHDIFVDPFAKVLIEEYEPDWVFTPIFDNGLDFDRWSHAGAQGASSNSNIRLVMCCSLAGQQNGIIGLVQCPRVKYDESIARGTALVKWSHDDASRPFAEFCWTSDNPDWKQSIVTAKPLTD